MKTQNGFTLIELMIVVAIAGVILTLALPNLRDFIISSRITNATNDLVFMTTLAKSEAVKRRTDIEMMPVSGKWSNGIELKIKNGDSIYTMPAVADKDLAIVARESALTAALSTNTITFNRRGTIGNNVEIFFSICSKSASFAAARERTLKLSGLGRSKVAIPSSKNCPAGN